MALPRFPPMVTRPIKEPRPSEPLPYMTRSERTAFLTARSSGRLSVFRVKTCAGCTGEVPLSKECCSQECWQKTKPAPPAEPDAEPVA